MHVIATTAWPGRWPPACWANSGVFLTSAAGLPMQREIMGLSEVSNILWRERQLLELLLFKLEEEQLLLVNNRTRWLSHAAKEIEDVLDAIRMAELSRAVEVENLAVELGLPDNASLRELATSAPEPWGHMLDEHRQAFLIATEEINAVASSNRELISRGQRDVHDAISWMGEEREMTYAADGSTAGATNAARLFDRSL